MCGIGGWLGRPETLPSTTRDMLASLHHRGPDQAKARSWPDCTFLHTRLRIIDLTESGDQPLGNEDGSIFTVFNGEIYNHAPLRSELERRKHSFRGHSDTEVIPHLYEEHDVGLFERLRGMFSIAIFDQRRRRLVLGRDRFGIKPLFYAQTPDFVAFSSEISALRLLPGIDLGADRQAVSDFTALLFVPAPLTIHRGIRAVRPGEVLDFSIDRQERIESRSLRFHTFAVAPNADLTLEGAIGEAESLVDAAVAGQLESDVPLGAMLSGGIDSSLVCAVAQGHLPGDLLTFGVRQAEVEYDETWAAEAVAQEIGSRHTTLEMSTRGGSWEEITSVLGQVGQPFGDSSIFAVDQISAAMRSHVTVALSGDGGDEGFGGYPAYWRVATIDRVQRIPRPLRQLLAPLAGPASRLGLIPATLASRVADLAAADDVGVIQTLFSWIRDGEHRRLVHAHDEVGPARRLFEPEWPLELPAGAPRLERLTAMAVEANLRLVLASGFLTKVDAASMRHSLEVRVPLLDEDLIAFGLTLPHRLRVEGRTGKRVLRGVAARHLPESIVTRPKHGFDVPVDSFIDDSFRARLRETLLAGGSPVGDYLDRKVYGPWVTAFCDRQELRGISRESLYERAIMLLSLDLSLRTAPAPRI